MSENKQVLENDDIWRIIKRHLIQGEYGDYLEDDGFHLARAIEAAVLSASAGAEKDELEVVGKVVFDTHFGWHVRVTKDWDKLGNGTVLYATNRMQSTKEEK